MPFSSGWRSASNTQGLNSGASTTDELRIPATRRYDLPRLSLTTSWAWRPAGRKPPHERINRGKYMVARAKLVSDGVDEECASGACPIR